MSDRMIQTPSSCPFLGLADDPALSRTWPNRDHRCYAQAPAGAPDEAHQTAFCLSASHVDCPHYQTPAAAPAEGQPSRRMPQPLAWMRLLPWAGLIIVAAIIAYTYFSDSRLPAAAPPTATVAAAAAGPVSPAAAATPTATPAAPQPLVMSAFTPTFTAEPGGRIVALSPKAGDAGWWSSGEARTAQWGDSFLYAGYFDGQAFISAIRFELSNLPRGAPIRAATLQLMGLKADRFNPAVGGTWSVQPGPRSPPSPGGRGAGGEGFPSPFRERGRG